MTDTSPIQSKDDFKSFILICAASSDFNISDKEHDFITSHIPEERYLSLKRVIDRNSDFECINIISAKKEEYLPSEESKKELLDEILLLFNSDHNYTTLERNMFLALKRIL